IADPSIAFFLGTQIGSLSPDIDHPSAMISNHTTSLIGKSRIFSHRGFTHSIEGIICMYLVVSYVIPWIAMLTASSFKWMLGGDVKLVLLLEQAFTNVGTVLGQGFGLGFLIGCISHSFIDLFNPQGILLSSLLRIRLTIIGKITRITTGTYAELLFGIVGILITYKINPISAALATLVTVGFWLL